MIKRKAIYKKNYIREYVENTNLTYDTDFKKKNGLYGSTEYVASVGNNIKIYVCPNEISSEDDKIRDMGIEIVYQYVILFMDDRYDLGYVSREYFSNIDDALDLGRDILNDTVIEYNKNGEKNLFNIIPKRFNMIKDDSIFYM